MAINREVVDSNTAVIETFVMQYMLDVGVGVQLTEVVAKDLFGQQVVINGTVPEDAAQTPREMLGAAIDDLVRIVMFKEPVFELDRVIEGAASLEFLVRYARKVNPAVIPPEVIPNDEVVAACLELFNEPKKAALLGS